jgi:16S rRNA (cytosine967-C5)-methyltransferase
MALTLCSVVLGEIYVRALAGQEDAMSPVSPDSRAPRRAALALLGLVLVEGRQLSDPDCTAVLAPLAPEVRARAQRLAAETLRQLPRADRWMKPLLSRNPPPAVREALRLGAVEIGQGAAAHGVVNDIVTLLAAGKRTANFKGLANAVLRRLGEQGPAAFAALPVPILPPWLRKPLVAAWGRPVVEAMERAHAEGAAIDLTAKGDAAALAEAVGGVLLPTGSVRVAAGAQVTALPGYETGSFWVQDAAAALPARLLQVRKGERVLDLCAAPGGKTMQLAAAGAEVTAVDMSEARAGRIAANLERTGLSARIVVGDALEFGEQGWDAILLDAPCSATGTIRRHPDLPYAHDGHEIGDLIALQARLIDHALTLLRPGGRLVFATCSLIPDEGEVQATEALARHPGLVVDMPEVAGVEPGWRSDEGGLRLRPDHWAERGGIDGFYMIRLRKAA